MISGSTMTSWMKTPIVISIIAVLLSISLPSYVQAQDENLMLEAEQNWDTYGVGGTCVYGTHNIFVDDVDGDGTMEIVTGGFAYSTVQGMRTASQAPLKVWSWNGDSVILKGPRSGTDR